ncbi:hypothetical protein EDM56_02195 [Brevibacillus fluminis]|uniref:Uncharacterized protein n=1 Tax=Brevibacillus fluminis TaxID=511487 RepID=A0A3M8DZW1_9BACL|nr:hypothetical protein [Brevibacillus fluminis]RNB92527.1 hypothetical protein EDM56_02195 [Brevibacillus fluminis]
MNFTLECIKGLSRVDINLYLGIAKLGTIRGWKLSYKNPHQINNELCIVEYAELVDISSNKIDITEPILSTALPLGNDNDEYPVLFIQNGNNLPAFIEGRLLSHKQFNRLIEKGTKLSKNSTKLLTIQSLRNILRKTFPVNIPRCSWNELSDNLLRFIEILLEKFPYLDYLPVAERREFRKNSIADASLAWELYLKYFKDEWLKNGNRNSLPDINTRINYQGWTGNFFDRQNPLLIIYLGKNGKLQFNDAQRELIYTIWKDWIT